MLAKRRSTFRQHRTPPTLHLNLIDFLSAYDAQRNPPVRRLEDHGMFRPAGQVDAALRLVFGLMR